MLKHEPCFRSNSCGDSLAFLRDLAVASGPQLREQILAGSAGTAATIMTYKGTASLLGFGMKGVVKGSWAAKLMSAQAVAHGGGISMFSLTWWLQCFFGIGTVAYSKSILGVVVPCLTCTTLIVGGAASGIWICSLCSREYKLKMETARKHVEKLQAAFERFQQFGDE